MPVRIVGLRSGFRVGRAGVAQLVEHLICNQRVGGSNPFASSTVGKRYVGPGTVESFTGACFCAGPVLRGDSTEVQALKAGDDPEGA